MGFLSDVTTRVRLYTDEPSTNAKYSDANILSFLRTVWRQIMQDVNRNSQAPIVVRHDVSISNDDNVHELPPTVGSILRLAKYDTTTGTVDWEVIPKSRWNPAGPGFTVEGNIIRFEPDWDWGSHTLRLEYIPNGDVSFHDGTAGTITNSTTNNNCTIVLASSPTTGSLDTRPNAYAGQILRILSATTNDYEQQRIITAYDVTTRTATVQPAFSTSLVPSGTVTYEVAPFLGTEFGVDLVSLAVARYILGIEGDSGRLKTMSMLYTNLMREIRLGQSSIEMIVGNHFEVDTIHNRRIATW
jgi:hypothetical protein